MQSGAHAGHEDASSRKAVLNNGQKHAGPPHLVGVAAGFGAAEHACQAKVGQLHLACMRTRTLHASAGNWQQQRGCMRPTPCSNAAMRMQGNVWQDAWACKAQHDALSTQCIANALWGVSSSFG